MLSIHSMKWLCLVHILSSFHSSFSLPLGQSLAIAPPSTTSFLTHKSTASFRTTSSFRCSSIRQKGRNNHAPLFATAAPINGSAQSNNAVIESNNAQTDNDGTPTPNNNANNKEQEEDDPFTLISTLAATTLLQSDRRRDAIGKESGAQASSATNWIDEGSSFVLKNVLDKLKLYLPGEDMASTKNGRERQDEAITWLRWMRSIPRPIIVNLSVEARAAANGTVSDDFLRLLNTAGSSSSSSGSSGESNNNSTATTATATFGSNKMQQLRTDFLNRLQCQLVLLPSGQSMQGGLFEPAGSLTFGKLLYGGVTRYRILPSSSGGGGGSSNTNSVGDDSSSKAPPRPPRRAGERTERKTSKYEHIPTWVQYGGTERRYDAVDMGPAMVLECSLLPKIQGGGGGGSTNGDANDAQMQKVRGDMKLQRLAWRPQHMFRYVNDESTEQNASSENADATGEATSLDFNTAMTLQGKDRNDAFASDFRSRVGGLGPQIDSIVRRVLDGRVIRPAEVDSTGNLLSYKEAKESMGAEDDMNDDLSLDGTSKKLSLAALEAEELALLGLTPVKGLLLYGPPGCGKTALAREIARSLRARAPKIVSAPELLDRWVGGSERLVRELFHDAEAELASVNGVSSRSALHVIVIDEIANFCRYKNLTCWLTAVIDGIDAVFRKRSSAEDSGEATRSSTVNQILAKLDGVEAIPNVLMIGMTNRRELLDEALLRPGRLEVQIEIPLPDSDGRREILQIHFDALRNRGRLSRPLCSAIDGTYSADVSGELAPSLTDDTSAFNPNKGRKRRALKQATNNIIDYLSPGKKNVYDLADDSVTGGFSGADLEGLVRCAGSIALSRARTEGAGVEALLITLDDVKQALDEVKV
ncbi:hypothetical protein ACHAXR_007334 [Thalassiosira sp. AJA248-18]